MAKKRRKDIKVKNSDGITRVKPIQNVGTDPDTGKKIQNIRIKRADGATITTRYADGEKVGETYQPKKMKMKKVKKIRGGKRLPRKLKKVKVPEDIANYKSPEVSLDEDALTEVKKREEVKKKKEEVRKRTEERNKPKNKVKRVVKRTKRKVSDAIKTTKNKVKRTFKKRPRARKVKNLVTGGTNILR